MPLSLFLRVVSGSRDTTLRVWDVSTGRCEHVLTGHLAAVRCVQYDGRRVVSGGYDYMVKVWDPETEVCLHTLQGHTNRVYSLQVNTHTAGVFKLSSTWGGLASLSSLFWFWLHLSHPSLQFDGVFVVSGSLDTSIKVWDPETGRPHGLCFLTVNLELFNEFISVFRH